MLGLAGLRISKKLTLPKLPLLASSGKKSKKVSRQVFLDPELWERLMKIADFQTEAWKMVDPKNLSTSRNTVIESFLVWAADTFWENRGGEPTSLGDREEKLAPYSAQLKKDSDEEERQKDAALKAEAKSSKSK